jgi:hypothetical protein
MVSSGSPVVQAVVNTLPVAALYEVCEPAEARRMIEKR